MADDIITDSGDWALGIGRKDNGAAGKALHVHLTTEEVTLEPTNLATSSKQDTGNTSLASIDGKLSKGTKTFSAPAPDDTATLLLAANANRKRALLVNEGAFKVYVGKDNTVTTANGTPLAADGIGYIEDESSTDAWWGITVSGIGDVRVMEIA